MIATRHKVFSLSRIWTISSNTFLELVRLKVFYFMLLFALLMIGSSALEVQYTFQKQFNMLKDVSLGAMSIFTWLLAVLSTAMLLPKDIEDRTLYTILAKPVPRFEYLLGKLFGVLLMLLAALLLMCLLFSAVLYYQQQVAIGAYLKNGDPASFTQEIEAIRSKTFTFNLVPGIFVIYLKAAVCASLTLLLSTFASSWIFTVITSVVIYFIGHVEAIARDYWININHLAQSAQLSAFTGLVALIFPDLQIFNLVDDIVAGNPVTLDMFLKTTSLGVGYVTIYTFVAYLFFANKEL
jgi:ABC-2 type transport system permease protein